MIVKYKGKKVNGNSLPDSLLGDPGLLRDSGRA
jgi:hypothetical protein